MIRPRSSIVSQLREEEATGLLPKEKIHLTLQHMIELQLRRDRMLNIMMTIQKCFQRREKKRFFTRGRSAEEKGGEEEAI
eukprot:scaffold13821_cov72-Skeletonema_dohrnii-CCMP3373.AAC.2